MYLLLAALFDSPFLLLKVHLQPGVECLAVAGRVGVGFANEVEATTQIAVQPRWIQRLKLPFELSEGVAEVGVSQKALDQLSAEQHANALLKADVDAQMAPTLGHNPSPVSVLTNRRYRYTVALERLEISPSLASIDTEQT